MLCDVYDADILATAMMAFRPGMVLRYGQFYGPGTFYPDALPVGPRIHVDAATERTITVLGRPSGILTITDDSAVSG